MAALQTHGFGVQVVDDLAAAREAVLARIPHGARVWKNTSITLDEAGISAEGDAPDGPYESVRLQMTAQNFASRQMKEIAAAPDYALGSVRPGGARRRPAEGGPGPGDGAPART